MTLTANPNPTPPPPRSPPPAGLSLLAWVAKLVGAAMLGDASFHKMTGHPGDVRLFTELGMEPIGRYLIGGLEGLAAIALLIPQSAVYGAFLALGAMCGAVLAHVTRIGLDGVQYALLVAASALTVLYIHRRDAPFLNNLWDD